MRKLTYDEVKTVMQKVGFRFFDNGKSYNLNIIGIRNTKVPLQSDAFDDQIIVAYINDNNEKVVEMFAATTNAGKHFLLSPMNRNGTMVLKRGQYRGVYKIGTHRGLKALEQVGNFTFDRVRLVDGKIVVLRENLISNDNKANLHRALSKSNGVAQRVGRFSAGCQVPQRTADFFRIMDLCDISAAKFGNSFTYTLLFDTDFD